MLRAENAVSLFTGDPTRIFSVLWIVGAHAQLLDCACSNAEREGLMAVKRRQFDSV
jgi:hypothetical protein